MDETTTRPATGTDAVALGVAWLNEQAPGWREQVDLSRDAFDIDDPYSCVLAQVARGQGWYDADVSSTPYGSGLDRAPIERDDFGYQLYSERRDWTQDHGFMARWDAVDNGDETWSSAGLSAGWRVALGV